MKQIIIRKGNNVIINKGARKDLFPDDYSNKTGTVLGVQDGTKHLLVKIKGKAHPVSFSPSEVTALNN